MNDNDFLLTCLESFEREEPDYYESSDFRQVLNGLFHPLVEQKIANVLWIPRGLRFENPDIDNLLDETFAQCQWKLNGDQIVNGDKKTKRTNTLKRDNSPAFRYLNCRRFVLNTATNVSVRFARRNGRPWYHGELCSELLPDEYINKPIESCSGSSSQRKPDFTELREILGSRVKDLDFELFRIRHEEGLRPREINHLYQELTVNLIRVKICRVMKAVRMVLGDPNVVRRLRGEENEERN